MCLYLFHTSSLLPGPNSVLDDDKTPGDRNLRRNLSYLILFDQAQMRIFLWGLLLQPLLLITWMDENNFEDKDASFAQRENVIFPAVSCQEFDEL